MHRLLLITLIVITISLTIYVPLDTPQQTQSMASFLDVVKGLVGLNHSAPKTTNVSQTPYYTVQSNGAMYVSPQNAKALTQAVSPPSSNSVPMSGSYYGGSGGGTTGGSLQPTIDTSALQNGIRGKISSIQNAYNSMNGNIDQIVQERAAQNANNYNQQFNDLNNAYKTSSSQLGGQYGARGLGDSSFYGAAQDNAANTYHENLNSISQDQANTNSQLGQYAAQNKAQFTNGANAYNDILSNLGQYDPSQLTDLNSQLGGALGNVQTTAAGLGTNQSFINGLNQIAPQQNQGAGQLATQLQQLVTSGAPQFAKNQIAQGLIKQAQLTDPNAQAYWNDYYNQLLNQGA
jgi:hypothetical protein